MQIESVHNKKIQHIKKLLLDKKYRKENNEFIAEGKRWIEDALLHHKDNVKEVFVASDYKGSDIIKTGAIVHIVKSTVFYKISSTENSQGILAIVKKPAPATFLLAPCLQSESANSLGVKKPEACEGAFFGQGLKNKVLYLSGISDPGNLGTIIRTAAASGFSDIVLENCVCAFNPKAVRASMGALLKVRLVPLVDLVLLKEKGYCLVAASVNGENIFTKRPHPNKLVLMIGSEAFGIDKQKEALCDHLILIPMQNKVESLNAAVSAGILMYLFA